MGTLADAMLDAGGEIIGVIPAIAGSTREVLASRAFRSEGGRFNARAQSADG